MSNNIEKYIAEHWYYLHKHPPTKQKNSAESQVRWQIFAAPVWQETQGVLFVDVDVKCNKMPLCLSSLPLKKWTASQPHLFVWKPETEKSQKGFFSTNRCAWD